MSMGFVKRGCFRLAGDASGMPEAAVRIAKLFPFQRLLSFSAVPPASGLGCIKTVAKPVVLTALLSCRKSVPLPPLVGCLMLDFDRAIVPARKNQQRMRADVILPPSYSSKRSREARNDCDGAGWEGGKSEVGDGQFGLGAANEGVVGEL